MQMPIPTTNPAPEELSDLDFLADGTLALEGEFFRRNAPIPLRIALNFQKLAGRSPLTDAHERFKTKVLEGTLGRRTVMVALAARLHQLEQGTSPVSIKDLAPRYLETIPVDPFSGEAVPLPSGGP